MNILTEFYWNSIEFILDKIISRQKLTGLYHTEYEQIGANPVQSTDYPILYKLKKESVFNKNDELWDIGCGMGRFIGFFDLYGHKGNIKGIEIDETYSKFCKYIFRKKPNISIKNKNALEITIPYNAIVYLYNPFNAKLLDLFLEKTNCKKIIYCYDKEVETFKKHKKYKLQKEFYSHLNCGKKVHVSVFQYVEGNRSL